MNSRMFRKIKFLFHEDSQYTGIWTYCGVYNILRCLSEIDTYMLRIHVFSIFTITTPRALNHEDIDNCTLTITYWL